MMNDKLEQLQKYLEKMEQFNHVNTLLYWDMRTNTPKEGFAGHSDALTYFSTEQFSMSTSDELKRYWIHWQSRKSLKSLTISGSLL